MQATVIVPTYDERENVGPLVERLLPALAAAEIDAEVLVVDDDSPDGTADFVAERFAGAPVRVLRRLTERGLSRAVLAGAEAAAAPVLLVMDADLSHPPERAPAVLAPVLSGAADMCIGSRYIRGGRIEAWPWRRRFASSFASALARPFVPGVRDPLSGFLALRRDALLARPLDLAGFKIGLAILAGLRPRRVVEVPITFRDRRAGESKLGGAVITAYLAQLARIARGRRPLQAAPRS